MNYFTNSRKIRCDSVLDTLMNEQKERLGRWLGEENRGYEEVRRLAETEFGIATSRSALSRYFRKRIENPECRIQESECVGAEELAAWRELTPETTQVIERATLGRARQLAFHEITLGDPDLRRVTRLMAIANKLERGQIERERVELEERRVALKERALLANAERGARKGEGEMTNVVRGMRKAEEENSVAEREVASADAAKAMRGANPANACGEASLSLQVGVVQEYEQEHSAGQQNRREHGEASSISRLIFDRAA